MGLWKASGLLAGRLSPFRLRWRWALLLRLSFYDCYKRCGLVAESIIKLEWKWIIAWDNIEPVGLMAKVTRLWCSVSQVDVFSGEMGFVKYQSRVSFGLCRWSGIGNCKNMILKYKQVRHLKFSGRRVWRNCCSLPLAVKKFAADATPLARQARTTHNLRKRSCRRGEASRPPPPTL